MRQRTGKLTGRDRALLALVLSAWSLTCDAAAQPAPPEGQAKVDARGAAKIAFTDGVRELELRHWARAKELFLEAYSLAPHPIVAYNAALACIALNERQQAADLLDAALSADPAVLSPEEWAMIRKTRDDLSAEARGGNAASVPENVASSAAHTTSRPSSAEAEEGDDTPQTSADTSPNGGTASEKATPPTTAVPNATAASSSNTKSADEPRQSTPILGPATPPPADELASAPTAAYVIGGSGIALLAASLGVYLWNDQRYDKWSQEDDSLHDLQDDLVADSKVPAQDEDLRSRVQDNNALIHSIQKVDIVSGTLFGVGILGTAAGAFLLYDTDETRVGLTGAGHIELEMTF